MNKKILIITLEYPPQVGGIASYVKNISAHLPAEQVIVYAPEGVKTETHHEEQNVYRYNPYWFFLWPRWIRMLFQVWGIIKKEHVDSIHVHQVLPVGYVAYLIKKIFKIPYTIFLHGTDLQLISTSKSKFKKFKLIAESAERIVVNSMFMEQKLRTLRGVWPKISILYPSPADFFLTTSVTSEALNELRSQLGIQGKKVMLTVARFVENKGYKQLINLLPSILEKVPDLVWIIVGEGPQGVELLKLIQEKKLQSIVRFLGKISYEKLPEIYQVADVFVLLTHADKQSEEGWGTVFLEAAAVGLPVVAGKVGGVEEAVEHLVTGMVVDTSQEQSIITSIVELLHNKDYAQTMGQQARARVVREFTWKNQLEKLDL
jgi:phosphatidylinositol alpha-1,6-mannosyltransferase